MKFVTEINLQWNCQTYKVWNQVSFDFSFDSLFLFFSFLLSFILGTGIQVLA